MTSLQFDQSEQNNSMPLVSVTHTQICQFSSTENVMSSGNQQIFFFLVIWYSKTQSLLKTRSCRDHTLSRSLTFHRQWWNNWQLDQTKKTAHPCDTKFYFRALTYFLYESLCVQDVIEFFFPFFLFQTSMCTHGVVVTMVSCVRQTIARQAHRRHASLCPDLCLVHYMWWLDSAVDIGTESWSLVRQTCIEYCTRALWDHKIETIELTAWH